MSSKVIVRLTVEDTVVLGALLRVGIEWCSKSDEPLTVRDRGTYTALATKLVDAMAVYVRSDPVTAEAEIRACEARRASVQRGDS